MGNLVSYKTDHGVALITLSDPPVNAYTHEMMKELDDAILEARFDPDIHALILAGAGERYFCCGADIDMLREADATFKYYFCLHANETLRRLEETPKLCIAALNGHAVGGGFEIALACDIRIARSGPFKVGLPEVKLGGITLANRCSNPPLGMFGIAVINAPFGQDKHTSRFLCQ